MKRLIIRQGEAPIILTEIRDHNGPVDFSAASSVTCTVISRGKRLHAPIACSAGTTGADWDNGILATPFSLAVTSTFPQGYADMEINIDDLKWGRPLDLQGDRLISTKRVYPLGESIVWIIRTTNSSGVVAGTTKPVITAVNYPAASAAISASKVTQLATGIFQYEDDELAAGSWILKAVEAALGHSESIEFIVHDQIA